MTDTVCLYPHLAPRTGYNYGCRCLRCAESNITRNQQPKRKAARTACSKKNNTLGKLAAWRQTPHGKAVSAANCAKRRAWKRKQSPKLNSTERQQVIAIYKRCQELTESTGIPHHVDHIIPLSKQGDHHPNNLQILTAAENMKKGARTTVTQEFCPSP